MLIHQNVVFYSYSFLNFSQVCLPLVGKIVVGVVVVVVTVVVVVAAVVVCVAINAEHRSYRFGPQEPQHEMQPVSFFRPLRQLT